LRPLATLALRHKATTLADIGTDHGLLAFGLAASGKFTSVFGVDASTRALEDGALSLLSSSQPRDNDLVTPSFRVGDGLHALEQGECEVVCIAGMGANSMQEILSARTTTGATTGDRLCVDELGVEQLVLQPTNSRPRNLIALYDCLYRQGWISTEEQLVTLTGRWYLTTSLKRRRPTKDDVVLNAVSEDDMALPVEEFPLSRCVPARGDAYDLFRGYLQHHCPWLRKDEQQAGRLRGREDEWLAHFEKYM
jgi:tRNA A22 N-methylase